MKRPLPVGVDDFGKIIVKGYYYVKEFTDTLRLTGYDDAVSIEHEDALMSAEERLGKAIEFLNPLLIREKQIEAFWI